MRRKTLIHLVCVTASLVGLAWLLGRIGWATVGSAIQRVAPLMDGPITSVAAVISRAPAQSTSDSRSTPRGDSSETATTTMPARARNTTCWRMTMSREAPMRSATAGDAASIIT